MKHFGKLQLIVILFISAILWGYDNKIISPERGALNETLLINKFGRIITGLGNDMKNIYLLTGMKTLAWDVSYNKNIIATISNWKKVSVIEANTSQYFKEDDYIITDNHLSILKIDKQPIILTTLPIKDDDGWTNECKISHNLENISCFQGKDVVIYRTESGVEVSRYTNTSTAPRANFEKMEWMSDHELALYDDGWKSSYENNILRMDVNTGVITEVCDSNVSSHLREGVIKENSSPEDITCSDTSEFEALFGSKEWPVSNLLPSAGPADDRFYFYTRWIQARLIYNGKEWTEGYDRITRDTFYVSTNKSPLKEIFGDLFIVDWFGWSWF